MKYAVVLSGSRQYKVSEGDLIEVDQIQGNVEDQYTFSQVLLFVDGETAQFGTPVLPNIVVTGGIVSHKKGKKIRVAKFKAKSRYRRVMGFRPALTLIKIETISPKSEKKQQTTHPIEKSKEKQTSQK